MPYDPSNATTTVRARGAGKPLHIEPITQYEARQAATLLIQRGLVQPRMKVRSLIDLMSSAGILPEAQLEDLLNVTDRSIRRYRLKHLLQRVLVPPAIVNYMPFGARYAYVLGAVGIELALQVHGMTATGYLESEYDKVSHDLLCNLVYYALHNGVQVLDYSAVLYSRYEATIRDFRGKALLEPDAMVVLKHKNKPRQVFLIEYHHEDYGSRAEGKVLKYERVLREEREAWQSKWQTSEPPTVLAVWTHKAVGTGYRTYFEERRRKHIGLQARWLGKPLQAFTERQTVLVWEDLVAAQPKARLVHPT